VGTGLSVVVTFLFLQELFLTESQMPIPIHKDYLSPQDPANSKWLAQTLGSIRFSLRVSGWLIERHIGEHRLTRVCVDAFDGWAAAHPDYPHPVQFDNRIIVVTVIFPPHDGGGGCHYPAYTRSSLPQMRPSRL